MQTQYNYKDQPSQKVAQDIINRGGPITHHDVNAVLAHLNLFVTAAELAALIALPYVTYTFPMTQAVLLSFNTLYPNKPGAGLGHWGVYMYINNLTTNFYVGSSSVLGMRVRQYWYNWSKINLRKILRDIRKYELSNFTLRIYDLPSHLQHERFLLALEQYYILSLNPQNNELLAVGASPDAARVSKENSVPVFMYLDTQLIYVFQGMVNGANSFCKLLNTGMRSLRPSLDTDVLFFGKFTLRTSPLTPGPWNTLPFPEVLQLVNDARTIHLATVTVAPTRINVTLVSDNTVTEWDSYMSAREYCKTVLGSYIHVKTIRAYALSGKEYKGFRFAIVKTEDSTPNISPITKDIYIE